MKYKAIFSDLDGTLVSFKTHKVPESAKQAIEEARRKGVKFFISTGRPYTDLKVAEDLPYDGVVALNGAECRWRDGRLVEEHYLDYEDFKKMMKFSDEYGFAVCLELNDGFFVNKITPEVIGLATKIDHELPIVCDIDAKFREKGCGQLAVYFNEDLQNKLMPELPGLIASRWMPIFADISVRGVTKASGISAFAKEMGISIEETISFGDGGNDIPMIEAAGLGIAMGNASDDVKAAADYITASVDDDGFAAALRKFV
ncbi:MAG: HAD family hydrolase [Bacteroidales bacterium]|nr:HAD family hydrolase [Bacteroidales bacterium]